MLVVNTKRVTWMKKWGWMIALVASIWWVGAYDASAYSIRDPYGGRRPITLDAPIVGFAYYGFGGAAGLRLGIPIVHNGFVPSINNAVYINFGVDAYWIGYGGLGYGFALGIPITLHWAFYFSPRWSAFAELGANIFLDSSLFSGGAFIFSPHHWFMFAVGGKVHLSESFALVLRLGTPYVSFGLSFSF